MSQYKSDGFMDMLHDKWYKVVPCGKRSFAVTEVGAQPPFTRERQHTDQRSKVKVTATQEPKFESNMKSASL